jgi:glycosyltransferase involved in cell wall biosynthesis
MEDIMDFQKLWHREPIADRGISVVIPAHSEAESIEAVVTGVSDVLDKMGRSHEIIVVNDGSTDATAEIVERLIAANKRVHAIHHATREGYGAAVRSGFRVAKYPLVLQLDGDHQYDPAEVDRLLGAIDRLDIVCGYRETPPNDSRGFGYWFYRWVLRVVFAVRVRDVNCGFRLFRRSALRRIPIQSTGRFANAEVLAKATFMNMLIGEAGVTYRPHAGSPTVCPDEGHRHLLREAAHVFRRPQFCTQNATADRQEQTIQTD